MCWTEWGGWALLFGVTCAWGRATHRLITTYVTVFPYRYKLHSHLVHMRCDLWMQGRVSGAHAGCWGLTFMCWGCPNKPIRCFCFLCSVIWKSQKDRWRTGQKKKKIIVPAPLACTSSSAAAESFSLIHSSFYRTTLQKLTKVSAH